MAASQTKDYQYSWIRDSALVHNARLLIKGVSDTYQVMDHAVDSIGQQQAKSQRDDWKIRYTAKFNLENNDPILAWSPQGDSPGLRSSLLMTYVLQISQEKNSLENLVAKIVPKIEFDLTSLIYLKDGEMAALKPIGEPWEEDWARSYYNDNINHSTLLLTQIFSKSKFLNNFEKVFSNNDFFKNNENNFLDLKNKLANRMLKYRKDGTNFDYLKQGS